MDNSKDDSGEDSGLKDMRHETKTGWFVQRLKETFCRLFWLRTDGHTGEVGSSQDVHRASGLKVEGGSGHYR